jgi:uncharacterized ParB-like nuclease family protein
VSTLPPEIQIAVANVRAWEATAKPGELPPMDVHAAAIKIQNYRAAHGDGQPRERAVDKFIRTIRSDSPPQMPAWDPALAGNSQSQPAERAADRFKRLRLANVKS